MDRHAIVGRDGRTDRQLISMAGIDFPNRGIRKLAHGFVEALAITAGLPTTRGGGNQDSTGAGHSLQQ